MSGGIQIFSIALTTFIPTILICILYFRSGINAVHKLLGPPLVIITLYFAYAVLIAKDSEDIIFIGYRIVRFILAIALLNYILLKKLNFWNELFVVLKWITIHAIFNFIISNSIFSLFVQIPDSVSSNFLFFFGSNTGNYAFIRNQGIFWEPGVLQVYLNLFLFINLFIYRSRFPIWVICALLISTLSTTGLIAGFFLILVFLLQKRKYFSKRRKFSFVIFGLPIIFMAVFLVKNNVEEKISGKYAGSSWARTFDTINGFKIAINNPLGIGFSTRKYQLIAEKNPYEIDVPLETNRGNTNSISTLFYSTGLFWALVFLFFLYRQELPRNQKIIFFALLILFLSTEPLFFTPFFILLLIMGMLKKGWGNRNALRLNISNE